MAEAIIEFRVKVKVPDDAIDAAETISEVGEALKDYLYDANNTRPYETDPEIVDVWWVPYLKLKV